MAPTSEQIRLGYEIGMREAVDMLDGAMAKITAGNPAIVHLRPVAKAMRDKVCECAGTSR